MNRPTLLVFFIGFILAGSQTPTSAETLSLAPDRDNTLYHDPLGGLSNAAGDSFFAGKNAGGSIRHGLLHFNVAAAIPPGSVIHAATLSLHMSQSPTAVTHNVALHRSLADWGEGESGASPGGSGAPATFGDTTWLHTFYDSQFWTTPGGDFAPVASAVTGVGGVGNYTWSSATLPADVQAWLDAPATNFGWFVLADESTNQTVKRFDSRESPTIAFRPILSIEYTPVPEPSSAALVALAALLLVGMLVVIRAPACARQRGV